MMDAEKCPAGRYSDASSIADDNNVDCLYCTDGYSCNVESTEAAPTADACPAGYWCSGADE